MAQNLILSSEGFSKFQLRLATAEHEKLLARIERDTIGWKWNVRQKDMLNILGNWAFHEAEKGTGDSPTVSKLEASFVEQMGVTLPTVQKDIAQLVDAKLVEKRLRAGSKKIKTIHLTPKGFETWCAYANQRAASVFAIHEALAKEGGAPKSWSSKIASWVAGFFSDKAKAAALLVGMSLFALPANDARAETAGMAVPFYQGIADMWPKVLTDDAQGYGTIAHAVSWSRDREGTYNDLMPPKGYVSAPSWESEAPIAAVLGPTVTVGMGGGRLVEDIWKPGSSARFKAALPNPDDPYAVIMRDALDFGTPLVQMADREGVYDNLPPPSAW